MEPIVAAIRWIGGNFLEVLAYPFNPKERIFLPYLATSLLLAVAVHRLAVRRAVAAGRAPVSLRQFLFPAEVWRARSAWLDVRYFFFHQILRVFLYGTFSAATAEAAFRALGRAFGGAAGTPMTPSLDAAWPVAFGFSLAAAVVFDFTAWTIHFAQHKIPLLWEFHKVHHSAKVMHPLTNYREHPVDNVAYAAGLGLCTGLTAAAASAALGYVPPEPAVMGVSVFLFLYNAAGYNLRHSTIWLRWPGPLVYVFGCPAHHQVHHSRHPAHVDKNFAFMLPVWDVVFGTFVLPEDPADVSFGLADADEPEFESCWGLYALPFLSALRLYRIRS
ncbi:MAG: sterol desaturase family protein [Elusimicrobia bacterium]|nr:sterol desaturase family protein [Elusimicrobiota bacterium]